MAKQRTPFAVSKDGGLFVELKASGIDPLCALIDGMPLTFFGKEKKSYITIDQAIDWQTNEQKYTPTKQREKIIAALRDVREKFLNGKVIVQ